LEFGGEYRKSEMGAAASVEALKPADASDVASTGDLEVVKAEVTRLRESLGAFAKDAGFAEVVFDASDLVKGMDQQKDFDNCVAEIVHIRSALRLSTAAGKRRERPNYKPASFFDTGSDEEMDDGESDSSSEDEALAEAAADAAKEKAEAEAEAAASIAQGTPSA
jgi:hypothetical protein